MAVPPETIQVKRIKRSASDRDAAELDGGSEFDGPDYLRLHNAKRQQSQVFIYQRITTTTISNEASPRCIVPTIHSSKPGEEKDTPAKSTTLPSTIETLPTQRKDQAPSSASQPRRFHFARPVLTPTSLLSGGSTAGKRSRNTATTVFVEHKHKRSRTEDVQMQDVGALESVVAETPPRKLKRPGADRKGPPKPAAQVKKEIPKSVAADEEHWARDDSKISQSMNDFALQIIGQNLAEGEERDRKDAAAAARKQAGPSTGRFKPTPPAKRFAERHPDIIAGQEALMPPAPDLDEYETANEDEYIVETYIRVPASALGQDVAPEKIGLLVFGNDSDADFFYGVEGDSDEEWAEDDEDENAENYYTADYPDEELDSGDEFDRDAYNYRDNGSDQEEFDERDDDDFVVEPGDPENWMPVVPTARMGLQPPSSFK